MPLQIIRQDITKLAVDAIVNAANPSLLGGGGVDGCIHRAAGTELLEECRRLGGCATGDAKITSAYALPCKYIIHAVGPRYTDGTRGEAALLRSCYRKALLLARQNDCSSVAFPLISSGIYGYPKAEALRIATDEIGAFLAEHEMQVFLTIFDKSTFEIGTKLYSDIQAYIDDHYVSTVEMMYPRSRQNEPYMEMKCKMCAPEALMPSDGGINLDALMLNLDESFSQMLLRLIDEKGIKDSECYKKANIDRKLFSKIRSDVHYKPSKPTAIAFAIALELPLAQTEDLLKKAGYALSHSNKFDVIIEYFIQNGNYNVFEINEALFAFDQSLLGA